MPLSFHPSTRMMSTPSPTCPSSSSREAPLCRSRAVFPAEVMAVTAAPAWVKR